MGPHTVTETHWADSASEASVPCRPRSSPPGSMGLVMADLISAAAASFYYFLIYNEIMGSEQRALSFPREPMGLGQAIARPRRSPDLEADEEVAAFPGKSGRVTVCGSQWAVGTESLSLSAPNNHPGALSAQPPLPRSCAPG